jgi:valyl-tRNA synthetase
MLEVVVAVRAIRARYKVPPKTAVSIVVKTPTEADEQLLAAEFGHLAELAGISDFSAGRDAEKPRHSASAIAGGMEIYVPLEGVVDIAEERARVSRELERAEDELSKVNRKLSNEGYLAKAAPEVVEKDRSKAAELAGSVAKLTSQLSELAD